MESDAKVDGHWLNESDSKNNNGVANAAFEGDEISLEDRTSVRELAFTPRNSVESQIISSALATSQSEKSGAEIDNVESQKTAPERGQWSNPLEFLLSCIAMSVGIGNFYRFPFVAYQNGGGAFLIPYLVVLFFIGKPIYFLELSVGQFCAYGQVKCWDMSPFFRGVGFGSTLCSFCVVTYYCSVMALTVYYLVASCQTTLPWSACDPTWAGLETCEILGNLTGNETSGINLPQLYFENQVLKQKVNIDDGIGYPDWKLSLCLFASWLAVFFSIVKGVQSSGKVAYFTAIYPYVVLLVLLITGCTKPGAWTGIKYFITPQWDRIYDPNVWYAAVGQCFFSLSTGFGPIIMYASYNPFRHNVHRDAMIVSIMDTFTSFLAGLTVFSILGNLAYQLDKEVSDVVDSGPGLVFVSYPDAISKFVFVPQLFAVLFFLMLFSLGVGSAVSWQMAVITVICDQFPKFSKFYVTAISCFLGFALGLVYVTPGGQFILTLVDNFGGTFTIYVLATLECIGIAWIYGLSNITQDIEFMLGIKLNWYWKICWGLVVPVVLSIILVYSLATAKPLTHNDAEFPLAAIACGWVLAGACLIFIPLGIIYSIWKSTGSFTERVKQATSPTEEWGPKDSNNRAEWKISKANKLK
ncbi:unnamed protein product [Orchesella dallaii]|uniref:Sodium-dependent nutrient amino acid transporter 1 n=1 Tax=Orchesella dallaii TaxID=48710 RepID=A0ABP1R5F1_9HEXA